MLSYYLVVGLRGVLLRGRREVVLSCVVLSFIVVLLFYCRVLMCCSCAPMCSRWCNGVFVFVSLCTRIVYSVWSGGVAIAVLLCWL